MSGVNRAGGCGPQRSSSCGPSHGGSGEKSKVGGSGEKSKIGGSGEKCPPGLEKKGGIPPGQMKHMWDQFEHGEDGNSQGTLALRSGGGLDLGAMWDRAKDWLSGWMGGDGGNFQNAQVVTGPKNTVAAPPDITGAPVNAQAKELPWVGQLNPAGKDASYVNGEQNCGPAILAMIAKSRGQTGDMTDAKLIMDLGAKAGTTAQGTSGNGMIAGLESLGMQTAATQGANLGWINDQLRQGHEVISNGDYYSVPEHFDDGKAAGHYIAVTGVTNGVYNVKDPADQTVSTMTAQQLSNFIAAHPEGGFSIAAW